MADKKTEKFPRDPETGKRIIYYSDAVNDDFAGNEITRTPVDESFAYVRRNPVWRAAEFVAYYLIALPLVFLMCKLGFGLRIKNRRAVRKVRSGGFFLYGNHTHFSDAYISPLVAFPKKAFIIANPDAVSIPGIRALVMMLGCLPIPTVRKAMPNFVSAVETRIAEGNCVAIYPEAHIWPFYTGIRPFSANSFHYQAKLNVPCVPMVMTYRNRKLFGLIKLNKPGMTLHIGEPIYPDEALAEREKRQKLRDEVYAFMKRISDGEEQYEHILYRRNGQEEERKTAAV
ncbi:MAG: 1-acyl-sn-glycerol-3-phosphate acyltransferase [Clostridia bacterium]|nr:1-acyl-sn-glycerol-3-phosphate acyltransferase [Clostridia bacterium]